MAEAIIKIEPFDIQQKIYITNSNGQQEERLVNLEELPDFLVNFENLKTVHMMGNEQFINLFVQKTREKELFKYKDTKLNILINE